MVRQYELRKRKENYCLIKKHNTLLWSNNENRPKRTRSILGFMFLYILSPLLIWRNLASVELCLAGIQKTMTNPLGMNLAIGVALYSIKAVK